MRKQIDLFSEDAEASDLKRLLFADADKEDDWLCKHCEIHDQDCDTCGCCQFCCECVFTD